MKTNRNNLGFHGGRYDKRKDYVGVRVMGKSADLSDKIGGIKRL